MTDQERAEFAWGLYKHGQMSADHTPRQVFVEVVLFALVATRENERQVIAKALSPCNAVPPGNGFCDHCAAGHYEQCRYVGDALRALRGQV